MFVKKISGLAIATAIMLSVQAASAATIFNDGATDHNGAFRSVESVDVAFASNGGNNAISFDLFGANSIDGDNGYKDVFDIFVNAVKVFSGSFNMSGGGANVVTLNTLGWAWNTVTNPGGFFAGGITSVSGFVNLLNGANTITVDFSSPGQANYGGQGTSDESWALNNVDVTPSPVPLPAALPLLALALGGLGVAARRRRKA